MDLPYIDFVGLWLNCPRADWRVAGCVKRGIEMALGKGDLPLAYFDAMATVEATVEADEWDENGRRWRQGLDGGTH